MIVGFTGTRAGMSSAQLAQLDRVLRFLPGGVFHHGAAMGADLQAAALAKAIGWDVEPHPAGGNPLARNRDIVAAVQVLIAAPSGDKEQLRSGTWATVRYARTALKPVIMLSRGDA